MQTMKKMVRVSSGASETKLWSIWTVQLSVPLIMSASRKRMGRLMRLAFERCRDRED